MDTLLRNTTLILFLVGLSFSGLATNGQSGTAGVSSGDTNKYCDTENKIKCGYWIHYGKDMPKKGYPDEAKLEEGNYTKNRKNGVWIKYWKNGNPKLEGMFVNGKPKGDFIKYSEDGKPIEQGTYDRSVGYQNELTRWDEETGNVTQKFNFNLEGKQEGKQEEFYPDGTPWLVYEKKDGHNVGKKTEYYPNGDVKAETVYNEDGTVQTEQTFEPKNPESIKEDMGGGLKLDPDEAPNGTEKFDPNGFNTLYNKDGDLSKVGEFKNGKFISGKRYKYDSDGILVKIEIWKNGMYHSDAQE